MHSHSTPASLPAINDPHNLAPFILQQLFVEGSIPTRYEAYEPAAFNLGTATLVELGWSIERRGTRYMLATHRDEFGSLVYLRRLVGHDPAVRRWMDQVASTQAAHFFERLSASFAAASRSRPVCRRQISTPRAE